MRVKRRSQTSLPMAPPSLAGIARPTMIGSNSRSSERARRVLQDIFLKGDRDPPGRAGDEADALIGIEPANRAHQSQLALAGQIVPRQARRAIDLRQFKDETLVAFGKLAGGPKYRGGLASDGTTSHPPRFRGCFRWCSRSLAGRLSRMGRAAWSSSFLTSGFAGSAARFSAPDLPSGRGGRAANHRKKVRRRIVESYPRQCPLQGAPLQGPRSCSRVRGYL